MYLLDPASIDSLIKPTARPQGSIIDNNDMIDDPPDARYRGNGKGRFRLLCYYFLLVALLQITAYSSGLLT